MGEGLSRRFMSFEGLIAPESLPDDEAPDHRARGVDPAGAREARPAGQHRSRLSQRLGSRHGHGQGFRPPRPARERGIYAHLEFLFTKTGVKTLDWTYPDLRREPPQAYFREVREIYLRQLRERGD